MESFTYSEAELKNAKHIHFVGIGGSGMFPLVQIMHGEGHKITGSDNNVSDNTATIERMGISVSYSQIPANIGMANLIVYTAAILPDNPELLAAFASQTPTIERAVLLGLITERYKRTTAISGTHGKTTTSSMLTQIMLETDLNPSAVLGGKLHAINGSGLAGGKDVLIVEACEFKDHFLKISPYIAVVLNIDDDHMEYFKTMDNLILSFEKFISSAKSGIILNGDDPRARSLCEKSLVPCTFFGKNKDNDFYYKNFKANNLDEKYVSTFDVFHAGKSLGEFTLHVPGEHNVLNAMAAISAAILLGVSPAQIKVGLAKFLGAVRRFQILGHRDGYTIADDYAHHPTALELTLKATKTMGYNSVWAIFQPFTFSRTFDHLEEFAEVLKLADRVLLTEIMGAREKNTFNIYSSDIAKKVPGAIVFASFEEIRDYVWANAKKGDLVITLGCGDVYKVAKMIL